MSESPLRRMNHTGPLRLVHLFYTTALVASAINLMGSMGLLIAGVICAAWAYVFFSTQRTTRRHRLVSVLIATVLLLLFMCLFPAIQSSGTHRAAARRMACSNNIRQLCLALHNYHSSYGSFPPAITYGADGTPFHSWRVLLLPYLEEEKLYKAYSLDEAWDGPNNRKLLPLMPKVFHCRFREADDSKTGYCVVVDQHSLFPPQGARGLKDIRDSTAATIAIVEYSPGVPWMAPSDPSLDEYKQDVVSWGPENLPPHYHESLLNEFFGGSNLGFVDGHVSYVRGLRDESTLDRAIGIDDGNVSGEEWEADDPVAFSRPRPHGYFSLAAFVVLVLLPAFWLFSKDQESGDRVLPADVG